MGETTDGGGRTEVKARVCSIYPFLLYIVLISPHSVRNSSQQRVLDLCVLCVCDLGCGQHFTDSSKPNKLHVGHRIGYVEFVCVSNWQLRELSFPFLELWVILIEDVHCMTISGFMSYFIPFFVNVT